jgi:serine/threonine protein kinase
MPGKPLDKVVEDYTTASKENVVRLLVAITKSLSILHKYNIFHGDIKYENILFDGTLAYFIDFGLSCKTDEFGMVRQDSNLIMHNAPYAFLRQRQTVGFFHQETTEWKNGSTLSLKTDVYALGKTFQQLIKKIELNDPKINALINSMCKDKAEERPSLTQVEQSFGLIISGWASRELLEKSIQPEGGVQQAKQSGLMGKF